MPVNKDARQRHEIIDECLRNRQKKWTRTKLLECVNEKLSSNYGPDAAISPSQIRYDLRDMEDLYNAPIEMKKEGSTNTYFYDDPDFSITKLPLKEEDVLRLKEVVHIMQQIKGFMIADEIAEIVQRLENRIKFSAEDTKPVIAFENPPEVLGTEFLGDIYKSIINKQILKIRYQHFHAVEPVELIIHPYFLKEYNNRWFLFGWTENVNRLENKALDRIESIRVTGGLYKENTCFDPEIFFSNIIGVTKLENKPVEKIRLLFSPERSPYVFTKKIHNSQEIIRRYADGKLLIELSLIVNKELRSLILGFGNDVEVIKPDSLRQDIKDLMEKALKQY